MKTDFNHITWAMFLPRLLGLLGVGLLASGLISWIAANWQAFTPVEKLATAQGLLLALGAGLWRARSRGQFCGLLFLLAVMIGGLFALIGQLYQTGADSWQLFAIWSALQLPLLLALPNVASALLLIATLHLTLWLYPLPLMEQSGAMLLVNLLLLGLSEWQQARLHDPWRVVPRVLMLMLCGLALPWIFQTGNSLLLILLAGGLFYTYQWRCDPVNLTLAFLLGMVSVDTLLIVSLETMTGIYLAIMLTALLLGWAVWKSHHWFSQRYPVHFNLMQPLLALLFALSLATFVLILMADSGSLFSPLALLSAISVLIGIGGTKKNQPTFAMFSFLVAMALAFTLTLLSFLEPDRLWLFSFVIYATSYLFAPQVWVRVVAVSLASGTLYALGLYEGGMLYTAVPLVISLLCWVMFYQSRQHPALTPLAWGLLLSLTIPYGDSLIARPHGEAPPLPEWTGIVDFYALISHDFFRQLGGDLISVLRLLNALAPIGLFLLIHRQTSPQLPRTKGLLALLAVSLFSLLFIAEPPLLAAFNLFLLSYFHRSKVLLGGATLLMLLFLWHYYLSLAVPLGYKAILLIGVGGLFIGLTAGLRVRPQHAVAPRPRFAKTRQFLTACAAIVATLGLANHQIFRHEQVIRHGIPILLPLAPADPRSIMQGDYMQLNYALLADVQHALPTQGLANRTVYALLTLDERQVAHFCRLSLTPPSEFDGCTPAVFLPITVDSYWHLSLPSHQFFFPEGQAQHFSQAQYGEYRVKDGRAILVRLRDANLKPL